MNEHFLPVTLNNARELGWHQLDFVLVSGDAYVDHPSFGPALIGRWLEAHGFSVGIIAQPDWTDPDAFGVLGTPRLAFLVTSGNMDSMVNHYSVTRKRRQSDAYSPGGVMEKRPDRAATVYTRKLKKLFPDIPVILGGIEASLRRMAHYDYWEDRLKPSILMDTKADLLVYGMGERAILEIAEALNSGLSASNLTFIRGTAFYARELDQIDDPLVLPAWQTLQASKKEVARSFMKQLVHTDPVSGQALAEPYQQGFIVQLPPANPLSTAEMDQVYRLPYMRQVHPKVQKPGIPAFDEVRFSLISSRGCFGGCHFCSLTYHQGRMIQTRSHEAILEEAALLTQQPGFKGFIHDVGGPTANFREPACQKMTESGACAHRECLSPDPCSNLAVSHQDYINLLRKLREVPGVKKVFIRSGIRYDYVMADPDPDFFEELCRHHVSGQLKVAPEHASAKVLDLMGKPGIEVFDHFRKRYEKFNAAEGKKQFLVPYLISSHPGSDLNEAIDLALYLKELGHTPEQVQDFYPTPGTMSTVMYYTGIDPRTEEPVYVPRDPQERKMQRALLQFGKPENHSLVREALNKTGRRDLIGNHPDALVPAETKGRKKTAVLPDEKPAVSRTKKTDSRKPSFSVPKKPNKSSFKPSKGKSSMGRKNKQK